LSFVRVEAIRDVSDVPQGERTDIAVLRATSQQVLDEMRRQMATENAAHRALTERWAYIVTEDDGDDAMILIPNTLPNFAKTHGSTVEDAFRVMDSRDPSRFCLLYRVPPEQQRTMRDKAVVFVTVDQAIAGPPRTREDEVADLREVMQHAVPAMPTRPDCPDCGSAVGDRGAEHTKDCPMMLGIEQACADDRAYFEAHPGEVNYWRPITDAERREFALVGERHTARSQVCVTQVADGVRSRRFVAPAEVMRDPFGQVFTD
jgi:hypothetical protein